MKWIVYLLRKLLLKVQKEIDEGIDDTPYEEYQKILSQLFNINDINFMKELTIEEKARRYDIAVELADKFKKEYLNYKEINVHKGVIEAFNNIFPELKEREDEMIKEMLIEQMKRWHEMAVANNVIKDIKDSADAIVWLEKQVEKKFVPKFKIGDTMRTLQEAKDGWTDGMPFVVSIDSEYYNCNSEKIAIKDQDEYEYPPMNRKHNICDSCDEQKPAWSEEDEKIFDRICDLIHSAAYANYDVDEDDNECGEYAKIIGWFKDLKERYTWRPSGAQIASLTIACDRNDRIGFDLTQLLNDLKKLKG